VKSERSGRVQGVNGARRVWTWLQRTDPRLLDGALAVALSVEAAVQFLGEEPGNLPRIVWVMGTCLPLGGPAAVADRVPRLAGRLAGHGAAHASQHQSAGDLCRALFDRPVQPLASAIPRMGCTSANCRPKRCADVRSSWSENES
jgi:hypothetical protein